MPETPFTVELPDGSLRRCYSPSSIVRQYFYPNEKLTVEDFVRKSRSALAEASARVEAKFGYACSAAAASMQEIEGWSSDLSPEENVTVVNI